MVILFFYHNHIFYKINFIRLFTLGSQQNGVESTELSHLTHVPTYTQTLPLWKRRLLLKLLIQVHFQIAKDYPKCQLIYFERSASVFLAPTY